MKTWWFWFKFCLGLHLKCKKVSKVLELFIGQTLQNFIYLSIWMQTLSYLFELFLVKTGPARFEICKVWAEFSEARCVSVIHHFTWKELVQNIDVMLRKNINWFSKRKGYLNIVWTTSLMWLWSAFFDIMNNVLYNKYWNCESGLVLTWIYTCHEYTAVQWHNNLLQQKHWRYYKIKLWYLSYLVNILLLSF